MSALFCQLAKIIHSTAVLSFGKKLKLYIIRIMMKVQNAGYRESHKRNDYRRSCRKPRAVSTGQKERARQMMIGQNRAIGRKDYSVNQIEYVNT